MPALLQHVNVNAMLVTPLQKCRMENRIVDLKETTSAALTCVMLTSHVVGSKLILLFISLPKSCFV